MVPNEYDTLLDCVGVDLDNSRNQALPHLGPKNWLVCTDLKLIYIVVYKG